MFFKSHQVVNTVQSLERSVLPERIVPGANMTDVNGSPSAMDEDGEEDTDQDDSPLILGMAVRHNGTVTDIVVNIPAPTGTASKRLVVQGEITAKRLGVLLAGVASW